MFEYPRTKEEARKYRYGRWAGNERGITYDGDRCAMEVYDRDGFHAYQCLRRRGYGPELLYCKQHAKKVMGER